MYKINTGTTTFDVEMNRTGNAGTANGEDFTIDIVKQNEKSWHLLHENKSYNIQVVKADMQNKAFKISVVIFISVFNLISSRLNIASMLKPFIFPVFT